jgi:hypothetical protein
MNGVDRSYGGVSVSSGRSSASASSGLSKVVALSSSTIYSGSGSQKREWRLYVNPPTEGSNQLHVQYRDPEAGWVTTSTYNAAATD